MKFLDSLPGYELLLLIDAITIVVMVLLAYIHARVKGRRKNSSNTKRGI